MFRVFEIKLLIWFINSSKHKWSFNESLGSTIRNHLRRCRPKVYFRIISVVYILRCFAAVLKGKSRAFQKNAYIRNCQIFLHVNVIFFLIRAVARQVWGREKLRGLMLLLMSRFSLPLYLPSCCSPVYIWNGPFSLFRNLSGIF